MTAELELLDALALGMGGVQINITKGKVTIATRYHPFVRGKGTTLLEATLNTTGKVLAQYLRWRNIPTPVMDALKVYSIKCRIR